VTVTTVGADDLIVGAQGSTDAGCDGFFTDVRMQEAGDFSPGEQLNHSHLETSYALHRFIELHCHFFRNLFSHN